MKSFHIIGFESLNCDYGLTIQLELVITNLNEGHRKNKTAEFGFSNLNWNKYKMGFDVCVKE